MTNYTNIIHVNEENLQPTLSSLQKEKAELLVKLGEIYAEEARLKFVQDALHITSGFVSKPSKTFSLPSHSGDLVGEKVDSSGIQSEKDSSTTGEAR